MIETADVVIAGGGIVGAAIAYHLVAEGRPGAPAGGRPGRVVAIERDPSFERASFARATGGVRQQFGHPANAAMARHSIGVYERFADLLAVEGAPGACGLVQVGYLFLADDRNAAPLLRRYEANRAMGLDVERIDHVGILMRVPDLDLGGIRFGILGRRDGRVDPRAIQESFERAARRLGAEWLADEVTGVDVEGGRVAGVRTAGGLRIATRTLVNACGAWAGRLGEMAGAPVPVEPVRRQLYVVEPPAPLSETEIPMVIDPSGVHFRGDAGGTLRVGEGPDGGLPASLDGPIPYDEGRFDAAVRPRLARRVPPLGRARVLRGWAGLYEASPDDNAILGEHPDRPGFVLAVGFSGHGVMMAPAAGLAIAELIRLGRPASLDIAPFRLSRFAEGDPIREEALL
jgi:FAD-dependent oxidoreductase domain-containing protein 1